MDHKKLAEHFGTEMSEVEYKEFTDGDQRVRHEVFVKGFRVGTGTSAESTTQDALKNGKYAMAKQEARLNATS